MKKYRNFKCDECGVFERRVIDSITLIKCNCGKEAKKVPSAARYFSNTTGKSPSI